MNSKFPIGKLKSGSWSIILMPLVVLILASCEKAFIEEQQESNKKDPSIELYSDTLAHTLYNGHIIAYSQVISPDSLQLTLVSLQEWTKLPSALNTDNSNKAIELAEEYQEGDLTQWHIPTTVEAQQLRNHYATSVGTLPLDTTYNNGFQITVSTDSTSLNLLNTLLISQQAAPITLTNGNANVRYLCNEGKKSFSFVSGTTISKAGTKATTYSLRLLTTLSIPNSRH